MTTLPGTVQERLALPSGLGYRSGDRGAALTGADVINILKRRIVLIVVMFSVLTAIVVGGFVAWWMYFPLYRAESLINCVTNVPEVGLQVRPERLAQEEHERFVQSQAVYMKRPGILSEALRVTRLRETDWYKNVMATQNDPLLALKGSLVAAPVRGTNFLRVAMSCRSIRDPAIIVNTVVDRWYDSVTKAAADAYAPELESARRDLQTLQGQIRDKQSRLKAIAERLPPGGAERGVLNITAQEVLQYGEQVATLRLEEAQLEQYYNIYNDPSGPAVTAEDRQIVEQDYEVAAMSQQIFLLGQQLKADEQTFGSQHREMRRIQARLDAAEDELVKLRKRKYQERRGDIREATSTAYLSTRHALFLAIENLSKSKAALQDQDRHRFDFFNLEGEIERDLTFLVQLNDHVRNLQHVVVQRAALNVRVVQSAIDPLERSSPSFLMLPVGVMLALALSVGFAIGIELLDTSVRTGQDITRHLEIAMLGAIPHTDDEEMPIEQVETSVRDAPKSMVAEAFRRVRTNLQFSAPAAQQRCILVTSPRAEDGKTSVATNLAMVIAQGGRRVLLVDANFRKPGLHRLFNQIRGSGLSNILVGDGALVDYAAPTGFPYLDVLGSGPIPPNPAELLGSEQFRAFIEDAVGRYDQVLVDSAPVLLAGDSVVVSAAVDGVLLVVRAKANSRGAARRACSLLTGINAHLFGAVLNAAPVTRGGYYREQLRAFYEYGPDAETDEDAAPALPKSETLADKTEDGATDQQSDPDTKRT